MLMYVDEPLPDITVEDQHSNEVLASRVNRNAGKFRGKFKVHSVFNPGINKELNNFLLISAHNVPQTEMCCKRAKQLRLTG